MNNKHKRKGKGRSRGGCVTCKQRRKKCDENRPVCGACSRLDLRCQYTRQLYWYDSNQMTRKGNTFTPFVNYKPSKYMLISSIKDIKICLQLREAPCLGDQLLSDSSDRNLLNYRRRSIHEEGKFHQLIKCDHTIENELFDYYVKVISKKKVFSDSLLNEFRSIIVPNSILSPSLFQSVIALSASDLIRKIPQKQGYYSRVVNQYKNQAINLMYNLLDNPSEDNINEIVVSILMLCSLEIGEYGNDNWINYLKQSCLIFQIINDDVISSNEVLLFCYRYFTIRYILLLTTLTAAEFNSFVQNFPMKLIPEFFNSCCIDYMFGCSPKLLKIIYEITKLKNDRIISATDFTKVNEIYEELKNLGQIDTSPERWDKSNDRLIHCSTIYLNATKLYFQTSFDVKKLNSTKGGVIDRSLINDSITLFNTIIDSKDLNLFPTWSLFIISINDIDDELRFQMLEIFEKVEQFWPKSSVSGIRKAIELIWKNNDLNDNIMLGEHDFHDKTHIDNDWRNVLSYIGFKLALV